MSGTKQFIHKWILDDSRYNQGLKNVHKSTSAFAKGIQSIGPMIAGAFAIHSIINFTKSSMLAYDLQERAERKVEQAIKSTGGAAGYTAEELKKLASQLQKVTRYGDEDILNKVTAQLLSFPAITGKIFAGVQEAVLDVATLLDQDLQSVAIALGKAFQDPIKGITAMRRMGIMFSKEESEFIKKLAEQNKLYEAQEFMLKAINIQYGGQARAAADQLGSLEQLKNAWGDLKEVLFEVGGKEKAYGMFGWLKETVEYFSWGLKKIQENGNGFLEWWEWFWQVGKYTTEKYQEYLDLEKILEGTDAMMAQAKKDAEKWEKIASNGGVVVKTYDEIGEELKGLKIDLLESIAANDGFAQSIASQIVQLEKQKKAIDDTANALLNYDNNTRSTSITTMGGTFGTPGAVNAPVSLEQEAIININKQAAASWEEHTRALAEFDLQMRTTFAGLSTFTDAYEEFAVELDTISTMIGDALRGVAKAALYAIGDMVAAFVAGEDGFDAGVALLSTIGKFMVELGSAMIMVALFGEEFELAVASMNFAAALIAGFALVLAGGVLQGVAAKGFAEGGIVYGPTLGLVGEYAGASTNPEVIAPLSKLEGMLGGGAQHIEIVGMVRGEDIYYVMKKQEAKQSNYR